LKLELSQIKRRIFQDHNVSHKFRKLF